MSHGRFKKILVVERDSGLQGYLSELLASLQYDVLLASDRECAQSAMVANTPDMALIGFNPDESSLHDFLALARSHFPEVRCLLYSATPLSNGNSPFSITFWAVKACRANDLKAVLDMCFGGGTSALLRAVHDNAASSNSISG